MSEAFYCQTQDLAIGYGKTPLLQNIGIGVQRGQILALIGPNGAGKSTLLKTLAGQLAAQSGAVLLQGQNLTTYTPNARARKMALMLPHTRHTELTTCFDVAAAGRYPYTGRLGILSEQDKQQVRDALHLVQADELADRDFTKISDGQRQRVLLARAVCQQPEIILLDEPTSFLDIKGKIELLTILRQLAQEKTGGRHCQPARAGAGAKNCGYRGVRIAAGRFRRDDTERRVCSRKHPRTLPPDQRAV